MITAKSLTEAFPLFFKKGVPLQDFGKKVKGQVIQHTRRCERLALIDDLRPNESEAIKEYRNRNVRMIPKAVIDEWKSKVTRIVKSSGFGIVDGTTSEELDEWLDGRPYRYLHQKAGWESFFFNCIFPSSIEDPNAVLIDFPYNKANPDTPPALPESEGGLPPNSDVSVKQIIVPVEDIRFFHEDVFSWFAGKWAFQYNKREIEEDFFFLVDRFFFYRYIPIDKDPNGKTIYELQDWFFHDTGLEEENVLPVNFLPGKLAKDEDGVEYQETFIHSFLEYADEFQARFTTDQAVHVRAGYPKAVMQEVDCRADGCRKGKVMVEIEEGKFNPVKCHVCLGTGKMIDPGPYNTIIKRPSRGQDDNEKGPVLEYVQPDTSILEHTANNPFVYLDRGQRSIGLNLIGSAAESGEAKKVRLQVLLDKLSDFGESAKEFLERHLFHVECLLEPNRSKRKRPVVKEPESYQIKDANLLLEEAKEALPADRILSHLEHIKQKYRDPKTIHLYGLAYMYSPLLALNEDEIKVRLAGGAYDGEDLVKRDYAVLAFIELSKQENFLDIPIDRAFAFADSFIQPFMPPQAVPLI